MLGDAQTYVGSLEHAVAAMPDLLKLRAIQQGMHGHTSDKEFGYLAKALEQGGVANDAAKLHARMETFARWMEVYRETFSVDAINEFYKGLKGPIARSLSEDFLRGAAGHFIQELGGHATGNALTQLYSAIVAGRAMPRALKAFDELGLLDEGKVHRGGPFGIRAIDPGAIKGSHLFASDPDKWITQYLGPALERFSGDKREELEAALFSDQTARNIADKILHQQAIIEKDRGFIARAPGLAAWETWQNKDPTMAARAVESQFENLMRDAAKPYMPAATRFMNWFSALEANAGKWAEQHPAGSAAAGVAAVTGLWATAGALARLALIKGGEAWAEGMAKATGEVAKEPGLLKRFLFGGGVAGGIGSVVGHGLISGLLYHGGKWALEKVEEKALGWTPEKKAAGEAHIDRMAHRWWRSLGVNMPWWEKESPETLLPTFARGEQHPAGLGSIPSGRTLPTFAALHGTPGAESGGQAGGPHVDTSEIERAETKAREAGQSIQQSLSVTASPQVDASAIDALIAKLQQAKGLLMSIGAQAAGVNARVGASMHALHDGPEAH
jgi:hypothetical protein